MFWKRKEPEAIKVAPDTSAEFDIEGLDVRCVERNEDGDTEFMYYDDEGRRQGWWIATTDEQHRGFVARLTAKIRNASLQVSATASALSTSDESHSPASQPERFE